jgi:predicted nucleic acid-binding protein
MKALDASVLVALLRGRPEAKALLRSLHGEELCAPQLVLVELEALARLDASPGLERRLAAVEKLRRRLTVLPIEEKGAQIAAKILGAHPRNASLSAALTAGALEAQHVGEWITTPEFAPDRKVGRVRTRVIKMSRS